MRHAMLCAILCVTSLSSAVAAEAPAAAGRDGVIGKTCQAQAFRQFDFWLGRWIVTNPAGTVVGHSRITRISQGCAIRELWLGRRGVTGNSLNYYDAVAGQWHQDWVGSGGQVLHLHGGIEKGSMVLSGTRTDKQGAVIDRITWTRLPDRTVRQHWEMSHDRGKTWKTLFLGTYTRETATASP